MYLQTLLDHEGTGIVIPTFATSETDSAMQEQHTPEYSSLLVPMLHQTNVLILAHLSSLLGILIDQRKKTTNHNNRVHRI
jgi:hypothetical protein